MSQAPSGLMSGKTCLVTGATSGIGKATALELAQRGAKLVMVCRDRAKADAAKTEIEDVTGGAEVEVLVADLSSQNQIKECCDRFLSLHDRLDVLVNNAGLISGRRRITSDGVELTFAVNHIAPFLITKLLFGVIYRGSRVVTVSSGAHNRVSIDFDNLDGHKRYKPFDIYAQSKLANVLFTYELARRLSDVGATANCVHPGVVSTNLGRGTYWPVRLALRLLRRRFLTPEEGADGVIHLASSPQMDGVTGGYFKGLVEERSLQETYDEELALRLWLKTESLVVGSSEGRAL